MFLYRQLVRQGMEKNPATNFKRLALLITFGMQNPHEFATERGGP